MGWLEAYKPSYAYLCRFLASIFKICVVLPHMKKDDNVDPYPLFQYFLFFFK